MSSRAVALAALFLGASLVFALWSREAARSRSVAPRSAPATTPARAPGPPELRPEGGYSIDARPCSIVGHVRLEVPEDATRLPAVAAELSHAEGARLDVPVTMSGFFGAGALADGAWTVRCRAEGYWSEERVVRVGPDAQRAELDVELALLPRLELTLRHPVGPLPRAGRLLEREPWLDVAWVVATRTEPGERAEDGVLGRTPLSAWLPRMKDDVAGGRRTLIVDGRIALPLEPGAWIAFTIAGRVVASRRVEKGERAVAFDLDEPQLARGLGSLDLRVLDAELGAPLASARVGFWPPRARRDRELSRGLPGFSDAPGAVLFPRLRCGDATLFVTAAGRELRAVSVELRPGETERVEVRLARETRVFGLLEDADDPDRVLGIELAPFDEPDPLLRSLTTRQTTASARAGFVFEALTPGAWVLRSLDPQRTFAPVLVDTRDGSVGGLRIEARTGTRLCVRRGGDGTWRPSERLVLRDDRGIVVRELEELGGSTDVLLGVLPGRYALRFERADGTVLERELAVGTEPLEVPLD